MGTVKFKALSPMTGPAENINKNKFCEFHDDKGHNIDECIHLRRQIKEAVKSGQLSHLIKEIKQGGKRAEQAKTAKKREAPSKDKATTIFMVQPWQRMTRQKTTQSFSTDKEISFPTLGGNNGQETPIIIEAEIEGHLIHRMYVDGGSASEVLYKHRFNRHYPKIKKPNDPGNNPPPRVQRQNIMATGANLANGNFRRRRALGNCPDEFHVNEGIVTIRSMTIIPVECRMVTEIQDPSPSKEPAVTETIKVAIHESIRTKPSSLAEAYSKKEEWKSATC
ncbi:hypothetical protein Tco_1080867 [Tanacetum coccineum]|uniref:Reverse transcriptase domain-containing protein n=1 Tax=Tanacetum coccineum TaxID=301880 RepID=A0ABQ5HXJ5_9ASTR